MLRAALVAVMLLALPAVSSAQDVFLAQLRRAVQGDDRAAVVGAMRYPITIAIGGLRLPFADATSVLERYDDIFTPALRDSIARGSQDITVAQIDGQWRITAITVPHGVAETSVDASREAPRTSAYATPPKVEPRRVAIRVGPRPTQIPGLLAQGTTDVLIVYLPKGRLASVRLERVPAGAAVIRVVHATTGAPLAPRAAADARVVSGRPAASAEYKIEVRRLDNADPAHLPYMLSLSLR
jgi:hypothetical protein